MSESFKNAVQGWTEAALDRQTSRAANGPVGTGGQGVTDGADSPEPSTGPVTDKDKCPTCGGTGRDLRPSQRRCAACRSGTCTYHAKPDETAPPCPSCSVPEKPRWTLVFCDGCGEMLGVRDHLRIESEHNDLGPHRGQRSVEVCPSSELEQARAEKDFWKQRYDTQHGTVHRLEAELRECREALEKVRDLTGTSFLSYAEMIERAQEIARSALSSSTAPEEP